MKKLTVSVLALACMALAGCGLGTGLGSGSSSTSSILGSVLGAVTNGDALGNILTSVIGSDKPSTSQIYGTWAYKQPGVAFTSENLLSKAGGEVVASQIKQKLSSYYSSAGIKSSNTYFTFNEDKTFSGKIDGKSISGTYTYDESDAKLTLKSLLFSLPCYTKRTSAGLALLFESKKLLTVMQTLAAVSGNSSLQGIGELSKSYDGVRLGFDMSK